MSVTSITPINKDPKGDVSDIQQFTLLRFSLRTSEATSGVPGLLLGSPVQEEHGPFKVSAGKWKGFGELLCEERERAETAQPAEQKAQGISS